MPIRSLFKWRHFLLLCDPAECCDAKAAKRFFRKTLNAAYTQTPRVINVDKNAAYLPAIDAPKTDEQLPKTTALQQVKYLNNRVEQDHRFIEQLTKPGVGFARLTALLRTLREMEAMNMIRKEQVQGVVKGDVRT